MLVVMAGLPGTGKSTVAEAVGARLALPVVSVDPIESAILSAGIDADQPTGLAAYLVAETLAERVVTAGTGVLVDAVNAVAPAREQWVALAERLGEPIRFIEVICSDPELHRSRIEGWRRSMPHIQLTWNAVSGALIVGPFSAAYSASTRRMNSSVPTSWTRIFTRALYLLSRRPSAL